MGAALPAMRLRQQPQQAPQIDWSNPITRGLVFAYTATANGLIGYGSNGAHALPYVANVGVQVGNAVGTPVATPVGYGAKAVFSSQPIVTNPDFPAIQSASFSLFAVATGPTTGMQSAIDDDDGTTRRYQFRLNAGKVEFIPFHSGGAQTIAASATLSAVEVARGFTMGATAGPARFAVFQNSQVASATPGGTLLVPTAKLTLGMRKSGVQAWAAGALSLLCSWSRTLSDAEMRSLSENPWQLFKAAPNTTLLAALGGAPVSAPASATGSLTWSESDDGVSLAATATDRVTASWAEVDDVHAASAVATDRAAAGWTEADDAHALASAVTNRAVGAWAEESDAVTITGTAVSVAASNVGGSIAWAEQDDAFSAFLTAATGGAPGYGAAKRRYVVRKGDQLFQFSDPEQAKDFLLADDEPEPPAKQYPAKKAKAAAPKPEPAKAIQEPAPEHRVSLAEVQALAQRQHAEAEYQRLLKQERYDAMLVLLERLREDEEDDWLLMAAD